MAWAMRVMVRTPRMYHEAHQMPLAGFNHRAYHPKAEQGEVHRPAAFSRQPALPCPLSNSGRSRGKYAD